MIQPHISIQCKWTMTQVGYPEKYNVMTRTSMKIDHSKVGNLFSLVNFAVCVEYTVDGEEIHVDFENF